MIGDLANHRDEPSQLPLQIAKLVEQVLIRVLSALDEQTMPRIVRALESLAAVHENAQLLRPPAKCSASDGPHTAFEHF
jgi:hypothetical protein